MTRIINLTQTLDLDVEIFPGDPKLRRTKISDLENTGYEHYFHSISDHIGRPHADAPKHQIPAMKDKGMEFFADGRFHENYACLIDLSESEDAETFSGIKFLRKVKNKHLKPFKREISKVGAVVIRTGYDKWLEENLPHIPGNLPYLTKNAAGFLSTLENLNVVGIDSLTIDPLGKHCAHKILTRKIMVVESMPFLHRIPKDGRKYFKLQTQPWIIKGATGAPVIANAYFED